MLSSKQRAHLKSLAHHLDPVVQVGKSGVTPDIVTSCNEVLEKRELIKISVLNNCMEDIKDVAETLAGRTRAEVVQVIGKKAVIYKPAKKPIIELPKIKKKSQEQIF